MKESRKRISKRWTIKYVLNPVDTTLIIGIKINYELNEGKFIILPAAKPTCLLIYEKMKGNLLFPLKTLSHVNLIAIILSNPKRIADQ